MNKKIYALVISFCMLQIGILQAREFRGIDVPDQVLLDGASDDISINGVGMRTKFFFDIYIGALYLEEAAKSRDQVLYQKGSKRILMHFVYDEVGSKKLVAGWNEGFEENLNDEKLAELAERIKNFNAMFETVHAGDEILLDYIPSQGTRITIKGEVKGIIEGKDFNQALLNIWLGDEPADDDLKEAMLNMAD